MAKSNYISMPVIRRLPRYYRHLTTLKNRGDVYKRQAMLRSAFQITSPPIIRKETKKIPNTIQ